MIARIAAVALPVAAVTLSAAAIALFGAWLRWVPPLPGFIVFSLALLGGGGASLLLGLAGVFVSGGADHGSRAGAALAAAIGLGCLIMLGVLAYGARGAPGIHDITTDPDDPPGYTAATENPANRGRDMSYPHGAADTAAQQRRAYADLEPIATGAAAADTFRASLGAADELGWTVVARDATALTFEAEDETSVFGFVDDVAVRVRARGDGSVVDVRSTSRVGVGDMGVNADRIRRFRDALTSR